MIFHSLQFLIFFPTVILLYFLLRNRRLRYLMLLVASYIFYMSWNPYYVFLIITSTVVTYITGLLMGNTEKKSTRKLFVIGSLVVNLGLILVFKYFNFFNQSFADLFTMINLTWPVPNFSFLLPVGISFYTLQALSYTFDVYRGDKEPEKDFFIFALYVSFFPQLVAGPIERSWHLLPQFEKTHDFDYKRITFGLKLMAWGFFKKLIIADKAGVLVDGVFQNVHQHTGITLIVAALLFPMQVYCDFSGYTDIAIGSAEVMGIKLIKNFKRPFFSKSIAEFWRRWHMSLMFWFRDYLYIPLGGNRVSKIRHYINILIVFAVSGLWHGANWTFIFWGSMNGMFILVSQMTERIRNSVRSLLRIERMPRFKKLYQAAVTYLLFAWSMIFFRSSSLAEGMYVNTHLFSGIKQQLSGMKFNLLVGGMTPGKFTVLLVSIGILIYLELKQRSGSIRESLMKKPVAVRILLYAMMILLIYVFGEFGEKRFIYFQF